jgi:outer membrane protein assembly factor BamB
MAMSEDEIRAYLGAELRRVPKTMTIVALTHAPPSPAVVDTLRALGVSYVLTGHAHSNRVVDHDGVIELNTEPFLMGGLDFTPAGYRVVTIEGGKLSSYHRTVVDEPFLSVLAPARGQCTPAAGAQLVVAAELDAGTSVIEARLDCATPIALRWAGGWTWRAELPALSPGPHAIAVEAFGAAGTRVAATAAIEVCDADLPPASGEDWSQVGGGPAHLGARTHELAPPLAVRWTAPIGGQVLTAAPVIAQGAVFVAVSDLGDGVGGVVALDLTTGRLIWRAPTAAAVRGGLAVAGSVVVVVQVDGFVIALDASTGAVRWRYELSVGLAPQAGAAFAPPTADGRDVLVGHQRHVAALAADEGMPLWTVDPVPDGVDSQSAAAIALGDGVAIGTFNRRLGGVIAWDRATGEQLWQLEGQDAIAINASPVIAQDTAFIVSGADQVSALELATGAVRWRTKLDPAGFDWGNATIGTPAFTQGILVVPTLYRDLVALDARSGFELWRRFATPGPLRTTHYRGAREAGFAASPVITGDVVWSVDTSGALSAIDLHTGETVWWTALGAPVLAPLATSGDWLVVASYDGTVRALTKVARERPPVAVPSCAEPARGGCCDTGDTPGVIPVLLVAWAIRRRRA